MSTSKRSSSSSRSRMSSSSSGNRMSVSSRICNSWSLISTCNTHRCDFFKTLTKTFNCSDIFVLQTNHGWRKSSNLSDRSVFSNPTSSSLSPSSIPPRPRMESMSESEMVSPASSRTWHIFKKEQVAEKVIWESIYV